MYVYIYTNMCTFHNLQSWPWLYKPVGKPCTRKVGAVKVAPSPPAPANPNAERMGCATPSPPVATARRDTQATRVSRVRRVSGV